MFFQPQKIRKLLAFLKLTVTDFTLHCLQPVRCSRLLPISSQIVPRSNRPQSNWPQVKTASK
jgi:hypothetical protein